MSNIQISQEEWDVWEAIAKVIEECNTDDFFEIAKIMNRDIKTDLAGADLHGIEACGSFDDADLVYVNFRGANLSGSTFRRARLIASTFYAAKLTGVNFEDAIVNGADFGGAIGLTDEAKAYLKNRGAVV